MTRPTTRSLAELQRQFASHIRDPDHQAVPDDVSSRRMRVYTELFYRNIEQLLAGGFPVIRRILPDDEWHALVRDFMVRHRCRTPLFTAVGQEFVAFLSSCDSALAARPFLAELARHEQLEVEAALAKDPEPRATPDADATPGAKVEVLDRILQLAPSARLAWFQFPVHRISPEFQPMTPPELPTWLLVYRDPGDHVRFMELNAFSYTLLDLLGQHPDETARSVLAALAAALGNVGVEEVIVSGSEFLQQLMARGVLFPRA
jgi:uncharacterized protein